MAGKTRRDRIIDAALALAAERPWNEVTLSRIADGAGVKLAELRREFRSLSDILRAYFDRIDGEMLSAGEPADETETVRDRVFELTMRRLDAMGRHKPAIRNIAAGLAREPGMAVRALIRLINVQRWILEAAGGSARGGMGRLRVRGLAVVYAGTFQVWLGEDDPGLPRTMATLDRALRRGERLAFLAEPPVAFAEGVACLAAAMACRCAGLSPLSRRTGVAASEG